MEHKYHECNDEHCPICNNGARLDFCEVCKGGEASLTTDCCGRVLTDFEEDAIMAKKLDFKNDRWNFSNDLYLYDETVTKEVPDAWRSYWISNQEDNFIERVLPNFKLGEWYKISSSN
jgi:hypothetical protein